MRGENCRLHAQRQRLQQEWRSCPKGAQLSAAPSLICPPVLWTSLSRIRDEREREGERPAHIEKTSSPLESNFNRFAALLPLLSRSLSLLCSVCPLLSLPLSLSVKAGRRIKGGGPTPSRHRLLDGHGELTQPRMRIAAPDRKSVRLAATPPQTDGRFAWMNRTEQSRRGEGGESD